jgi:alginate O-acetyltransferase complex protein AlgI
VVFSSFSFLFLFFPVFLVAYRFAPAGLRNAVILVFSWIFYAWWRLDYLPLLAAITVWAWAIGLVLARAAARLRKPALVAGIAGLLSALAWFKYANLFVGTARDAGLPIEHWQNVILPIGLSFFVFGAISYVVDVYRGTVEAERNLIDYATYQAVFPHLVAGPIVRYASIAPELHRRVFDRAKFAAGVERFSIAFAMKILLADTLAPLVDAGFKLAAPSMADAWLATAAYTLQLYFDFAAYSSMAIGLGLMMGLTFPENFNNPYLSRSVGEFWRRWHMSLSSWLRDYLYIPLGGSRDGTARTCLNLAITMGLGGLWHGASWTFMAWGLWHGLGLVTERLWKTARLPAPPAALAYPLTLAFVLIGWTLFRSNDWGTAATMFGGLLGRNGVALSASYAAAIRPVEIVTLLLGIALVYAPLVQFRAPDLWRGLRTGLGYSAFVLLMLSLWTLQGRTVTPFLYFQF